jgi:hypothetical protein
VAVGVVVGFAVGPWLERQPLLPELESEQGPEAEAELEPELE